MICCIINNQCYMMKEATVNWIDIYDMLPKQQTTEILTRVHTDRWNTHAQVCFPRWFELCLNHQIQAFCHASIARWDAPEAHKVFGWTAPPCEDDAKQTGKVLGNEECPCEMRTLVCLMTRDATPVIPVFSYHLLYGTTEPNIFIIWSRTSINKLQYNLTSS
jgi:hypothetical protein